ncbi:MAG TPA: VWA domain-containing protein [Solirubrobacteraceae bacterium]|nr:VWA domain-containing protein [Solirubrobacteraceae bacterium]
MSFQTPLLLLGLLLIPLGFAAYAVGERRRRRAAAAWAAPATAPSVVPRRPGWRRHAPLALSALAMAGLIAALARPQVSVAVPAEQASIVLAMDRSGSMQATDVSPSRLAAALTASEAFIDNVPDRVRVGGLVFHHRAEAVQNPTTDRAALRSAMRAAMVARGGTATGEALAASLAMLRAPSGPQPPGAIVLLSDGESTSGRDPLPVADEARALGIPVYTVALGTAAGTLADGRPVPPDPASLQAIADRSGGQAYTAAESGALRAVYEELGSRVAEKQERREVTGAFAGGAIVLLAAGAAMSLRWFRRLL